MVGVTELIETAPHEFSANYNFADGLQPYFALDAVIKQGGGSVEGRFDHNGESWTARLSYKDCGIKHPGDTTPFGTPFTIETIREFELKVASDEDSIGERDFYAKISPRWNGMEGEGSDGTTHEIRVPFDEGINVSVSGSNIEFREYSNLLQQAARTLGLNGSYFAEPHGSSNVKQAERYVRISEDESGPVHARDGPLARIGHLLESDTYSSPTATGPVGLSKPTWTTMGSSRQAIAIRLASTRYEFRKSGPITRSPSS